MMTMRTYTELSKLKTFEERFEYLKLNGIVSERTFGGSRWMNQMFYQQIPEWKEARRKVIVRDLGCELGLDGYPIKGRIIVHHMNPITKDDISGRSELVLDPEYLICVSQTLHDAIHYGNAELLPKKYEERKPGDTCPWKQLK